MKIILTALLGVMLATAQAQNNAIFNGGNVAGWNTNAFAQTGNNIFSGGNGNGWHFSPFIQTTANIWAGGDGDGWSWNSFLQPGNNIFLGGNGDGWTYLSFTQAGNNIFDGGDGDGWANTYRPMGPLPVQFISFTAVKEGATTLLKWQTAREEGAAYFDVERSADAVRFEKIGRVDAVGNSVVTSSYSYVDAAPFQGHNYYRLKQVDRNGTFVYTPTRLVLFDGSVTTLKVYPVPATAWLTVEMPGAFQNEAVVLQLSNAAGVMVNRISLQKGGTVQYLNVQNLPAGVYHLQVVSKGSNTGAKIIKQ